MGESTERIMEEASRMNAIHLTNYSKSNTLDFWLNDWTLSITRKSKVAAKRIYFEF